MGRRRSKRSLDAAASIHGPLCSVCYNFYSASTSSIVRCADCQLSSRSSLCERCFNNHVINTVGISFAIFVQCPEPQCHAFLSKDTVYEVLVRSGNTHQAGEYLQRCNWKGTSSQWIKKFAVPCPHCQTSIEKNGGCDNMNCYKCKLPFSWTHAQFLKRTKLSLKWYNHGRSLAIFFYRCFVVIVLLILVKYLVWSEEKIITTVQHAFSATKVSLYGCFTRFV